MRNEKILPVILCGGTGTRLWPLSRASFPKQYLAVTNKNSLTFFQETITRVDNMNLFNNPLIICNEEHRFIVAEQIREININPNSILLEPIGRNTAPAITLAALKANQDGSDPILLVLPSDHIIRDSKKFQKILETAIEYCNEGKLVTFGITPDKAETGYGYIEADKILNPEKIKGEKIIRFIEKPSKKIAEKLLTDKRFSWNSGIFLFKASIFLNEIKEREPNIFRVCKESLKKNLFDLDFQRVDKDIFSQCQNISIDNAIMEKTSLGYVLPLNAGWSDIGSWESMWEVANKDKKGNFISGDVITNDVSNSYLRSENRMVVGIGFEDLIIVETIDAILVAKKNQTQKVKDIVQNLLLVNKNEANMHKTIYRPWGSYTSIAQGSNWQVKKIIVKSKESLSLQMHNRRAEHWIIVSGIALVEIDGKESMLKKNENAYIPLRSKHRLSNPGEYPLILIEVQSGDYLGEDDIIRFEDNYGR